MQTHTMVYQKVLDSIPKGGVPVNLECLNDPLIKSRASYGSAHLRGMLGYVSCASGTNNGTFHYYVHFKNSNDVRELVFKANPNYTAYKPGGSPEAEEKAVLNPKVFDDDTSGWIEGNGRTLDEMTQNMVYFQRTGTTDTTTPSLSGGKLVFTLLVFIEYDGVQNGIAPRGSVDKPVVSFQTNNLGTAKIPIGQWGNVYNDDPGFIPDAVYAIKAFDLMLNDRPLNPLIRVTGISSQAGLELVVPANFSLFGVDVAQFVPYVVPAFYKQNIRIDLYAPACGNAGDGTEFGVGEMYTEFLVDRNSVR